jgi:hypothetical protein
MRTTTQADTTTVRQPRTIVEQIRMLANVHDRSLTQELRERDLIDAERAQ